MGRVSERRVFTVDAASAEAALIDALTETNGAPPRSTRALEWEVRDARGPVTFLIHVALTRATTGMEVSLVVERERSLGGALAGALSAVGHLLDRRPTDALEGSAAADIAAQDAAAVIAQALWESFEARLVSLAREGGGVYRGA